MPPKDDGSAKASNELAFSMALQRLTRSQRHMTRSLNGITDGGTTPSMDDIFNVEADISTAEQLIPAVDEAFRSYCSLAKIGLVDLDTNPFYVQMNTEVEVILDARQEINRYVSRIQRSQASNTTNSTSTTPNPPTTYSPPNRINTALKPERLLHSASLAEFRSWRSNFDLYYSSNKMDMFPLLEQHGYVKSCIEMKLQHLLDTSIQPDTPVYDTNGVLEKLRDIFLQNIPVLTRRYNFFCCNQKTGEKFGDWFLRLQLEAQEAELDLMTTDDLFVLRLVTGTNDLKLREEFLRQTNPSKDTLVGIARSWETAASVGENMCSTKGNPHQINAAVVSNKGSQPKKKFKGRQKQTNKVSKDTHVCFRCGQANANHKVGNCPAKGKQCNKCGTMGHLGTICMKSRNSITPSSSGTLIRSAADPTSISSSSVEVRSATTSKPTPRVLIQVFPNDGIAFQLKALPDTGATETLVASNLILERDITIAADNHRNIIAANGTPLDCLGSVSLLLKYGTQHKTRITAFVTSDLHDEMLLSWHHMIELNMLPQIFPDPLTSMVSAFKTSIENIDQTMANSKLHGLFKEFPSVFDTSSTLKPMKGKPMHIYLRDDIDIIPTHLTVARNIPYAHRAKTETEIGFMENSTIIERAEEPSDWVSPCLVVPKPDGSVRLVIDYTGLNKYVKRPIHPFPSPSELSTSIPSDSQWFVVLDAVKGYWQVELDEESRKLTTFITPFGRFRFRRAPMGLNASGDEYCLRGDKALAGLQGVKKIVDDILIHASNFDELMTRTKTVLQKCAEAGITLSKKKAQIGKSVKFAGFIVCSDGIKADPDKVIAISKFPTPSNISELRSFFGLANQLGQFVPDLAHALSPLRPLLKKDVAYQWLSEHEEAFKATKSIIVNPQGPILAHFDISLSTTLLTDASRLRGLGFALTQTHSDGTSRLVQCGSRFLTDTETRYATIELEALAIQWAITRCRLYLHGIHFNVITDHKPLRGVFRGTNFDAVENPRIQRILVKLSDYTFTVDWVPGKTHQIADALSRSPVFDPHESSSDDSLISVSTITVSHDQALKKLIETAGRDPIYQSIKSAIQCGHFPRSLPQSHPAKLFSKMWDFMSIDISSGLILVHGTRIVVPLACHASILKELHRSHQGQRRTKSLAKSLYFWPGINHEIDQMVQNCPQCQENLPKHQNEPLIQTSSNRPFEQVSADLFEYGGKHYFVLVDRYSGWPCVSPLTRLDTVAIIKILMDIFCTWGIPSKIRTDGGPQFRNQFSDFCQEYGIEHELCSSYNARSNGHAEAAVKAMKSLIIKHNQNWAEFQLALLQWRNVPRTDGLSPAQWVFCRRQRTLCPTIAKGYDLLTSC